MAGIYDRLSKTALRLVTKYGRTVTIKFATDAAPPDPTKPWDPAPPTLVSFVTKGVITSVGDGEVYARETTILAEDEQIIVAARGMPAVPDPKSVILDGSTQYKVVGVASVEPGPTPLVYFILVRR